MQLHGVPPVGIVVPTSGGLPSADLQQQEASGRIPAPMMDAGLHTLSGLAVEDLLSKLKHEGYSLWSEKRSAKGAGGATSGGRGAPAGQHNKNEVSASQPQSQPLLASSLPSALPAVQKKAGRRSAAEVPAKKVAKTAGTSGKAKGRTGAGKGRARVPKTRQCERSGCEMEASFGFEGERKRTFCSTHRVEGMINVKHKQCMMEGCTRQPSYGVEGGKSLYCSSHKTDNMINLVRRRCKAKGCSRLPTFAAPGQKASFCAHHKTDDMVDTTARRCEAHGCQRLPSYSFQGDRVRRFCGIHKQQGMVSVKRRTCIAPDCGAEALLGATPYCSSHIGMARCVARGCHESRVYGPPGGTAMYCFTHKAENMSICLDRCRRVGCVLTSSGESGLCNPHAAEELAYAAAQEPVRKRPNTGGFSLLVNTPGAWGGEGEEESGLKKLTSGSTIGLLEVPGSQMVAGLGIQPQAHSPMCECSDCMAWRASAGNAQHNPPFWSPHYPPGYGVPDYSGGTSGGTGGAATAATSYPGFTPTYAPPGFPFAPPISPLNSPAGASRGGGAAPSWHPLPMFWPEHSYTHGAFSGGGSPLPLPPGTIMSFSEKDTTGRDLQADSTAL